MYDPSISLDVLTLSDTVRLEIGGAGQQLPEHVRKNSAVLVIIDLHGRVDAQSHRHVFGFFVRAMDHQRYILLWLHTVLESEQIESLSPVQIQRRGVHTFFELTGQHAHADQVAAVNALEA